ncbi:hypothetical protein BXZ70DRAFT_1065753 [Cristinia sonorae]|uniref:Uncharacterized protein n=1 Tax=Cristinia sonorae TaxID=1940300 RepID=A0A8K0UMV6_9AGAR|nr:hypothetical protein BXZ70DRAFT_1065753 [Cristinia sonorae]
MDIPFDSSWCPICSRQILPKRFQVPIAPPPVLAPAPAPPPSSPVSQPKASNESPARLTRTKNGTIRARTGGLVHGTGRVKPNGTIKRSHTKKASATPAPPAVEAPKPSAPVRHRTVIDQGPIPLYCSDECRLADLQSSFDNNPDRHAFPPLPPVPHNSFSDLSATEESDSSSASGKSPVNQQPASEAYAALARIYDLPPCPPPPPLLRTDTSSSNESFNDYSSGVMMAARRIQAALCPPQPAPKRASWSTPSATLSTAYALGANSRQQQKPVNNVIPGWTDSSNWRASVYSFAPPTKPDSPFAAQESREASERAYRGFVATPHRSRGVYSTMGESSSSTSSVATTAPPVRSNSDIDDLYSKFEASLSRRSESRAALAAQHVLSTSPTGSIRSLPANSSSSFSSYPQHSRRREVLLLKPGAEGKLLVPKVTMRRTPSSLSSYESAPRMKHSPLSRQGSELSVGESVPEEDEDVTMRPQSLPTMHQRPEVRSWSYSDLLTYPIMELPFKKEKRIEKRVVGGKEVEIEVEVEIIPERKRLFLFPGKSAFPSKPSH